MTKNKHIDTYNTIYLIDVVVANEPVTLEDLKDTYCYSDNEELDEDITNNIATTATCRNKKTNKCCILIKYNHPAEIKGIDKKLDLINTIAHESTHAAIDIFCSIGESINMREGNEAFVYFVGWISECVYKTLMKK